MLKNIPQLIKSNLYEIILLISTVIYAIYFSVASFLKYDNFYTGKYDLGNMSQTVWNTIHGNFFMMTDPNETREVSRLAFHADFILILLSPFYFLWENPKTLLAIQTAVLSMGGIFVYLIADKILRNKLISLTLAISYFIYPALNYANLYDFHAVALATTFFLAAFYFILEKKWKTVLLFLILAGICKEQIWLINALIALYLFFFQKQKRLGLALFIYSILVFYVLIWHLIPQNLGKEHFALSFYSDFGDSPEKIIRNVFLHPSTTLSTLLMEDRLTFVKQLFLPLGYLSFLAPLFLVFAGPDLAINLLSNNSALHQIYYQYSSTVTPFVFISAIYSIKFIKSKLPDIPYSFFAISLLLFSISSSYEFGPLPYAKHPNIDMFVNQLRERKDIDLYISTIGDNEKITATNNLGAQLSHRRNIYVMPQGLNIADRALFLSANYSNSTEINTLNQMFQDPNYTLTYQSGRFYAFQRIK